MRRSGYLAFALLQLSVAPAFAEPVPETGTDWLKTMSIAAHQTDYSGVFVFQSGGRVEMSRITHVSDKDGEHERLEGLGGTGRELIRNNDQVWLYTEGRKIKIEKRQQVKRTFPALLPEQLSILKDNYRVRQEEDTEIAGYQAHTIVFQPRDSLRYTRVMWADIDSGLLLKAAVLDDRGYAIEQYAFMQLDIDGEIDRKWIALDKATVTEHSKQTQSPPAAVEPLAESSGWQVDALPPGFKKMFEVRRQLREKQEPVIQLVFTDGLAGISVFIEKTGKIDYNHAGLSGEGATHVYTRNSGDHLVTVVGEVPPMTVIQVGDSVRYAGH